MSRIPNIPFRINVYSQIGPNERIMKTKNCMNFAEAMTYRDIALRQPNVKKVEVLTVIDETTPAAELQFRMERKTNGDKHAGSDSAQRPSPHSKY